jgi:hypothetical protein
MKFHRLVIALTVFNLGLLVFLLAQIEVRFLGFRFLLRSPEVNSAGSVLRGRGLEITDDEGRVRASIKLHPASVLLRLISSQGRPNVKIAATEDGSALALGGEADPTHVAIGARGTSASLKLVNKDGQQLIKP